MSQKKRVRIYKAGGQQGQYINPTAKWMMQMGGQEQGQDEQIMIAVQQAILQGAEPNEVYDNLVAQGLPGNKVGQIVQLVLDNIDTLEEEAYVEESGDQDAAIELAQREAEEMQAQSQNQFNDMMQGAPSVDDLMMEDDDNYDDTEFEDDLYDLQKGGIPKRDDFIKQVKKQYGGKVKQGQKPEDVSSEQVFNFLDKVKQSNEQALLDKQLEQQATEYYDNVMLPEAQRGREVRRARRQQRQLNRGINKIMRNTPVGFMGQGMLPQNIGVINPFGMPQTMPQGNMQGFPGLQMANIEVHKTGLFGRPKQYSMTFNYNTPDPIKEAEDVATSTVQSIKDNESRKEQEGKPSNKEAAEELEQTVTTQSSTRRAKTAEEKEAYKKLLESKRAQGMTIDEMVKAGLGTKKGLEALLGNEDSVVADSENIETSAEVENTPSMLSLGLQDYNKPKLFSSNLEDISERARRPAFDPLIKPFDRIDPNDFIQAHRLNEEKQKQLQYFTDNPIFPKSDLGEDIIMPGLNGAPIPRSMADAERMIETGELQPESLEAKKVRFQREADEREADRRARVEAYNLRESNPEHSSFTGLPGETWRETLAAEAAPLRDAMGRVSYKDNFFDDYINPLNWIYSMAGNLGEAPKLAQDTDSYTPYISAIGQPLIGGALGSIGANSTTQFARNLVDPLSGIYMGPRSSVVKQIPNYHTRDISPNRSMLRMIDQPRNQIRRAPVEPSGREITVSQYPQSSAIPDDAIPFKPIEVKTKAPSGSKPDKVSPKSKENVIAKTMDEALDVRVPEIKNRGKQLDNSYTPSDIKKHINQKENINFLGTYKGRPIVEVKLPNGETQLFYKSTGRAGKIGSGVNNTTESLWQPFGGFYDMKRKADDFWFIKSEDYVNYYGSDSFKVISDNLNTTLSKKLEVPLNQLDNKINFKNNEVPNTYSPTQSSTSAAVDKSGTKITNQDGSIKAATKQEVSKVKHEAYIDDNGQLLIYPPNYGKNMSKAQVDEWNAKNLEAIASSYKKKELKNLTNVNEAFPITPGKRYDPSFRESVAEPVSQPTGKSTSNSGTKTSAEHAADLDNMIGNLQQGGFVNPFQSNPLAEFLYGGNLPKARGGWSGQGCVVNPNTGATNCFPSNNSQTGNVKPLNEIDNENQPPQWFKDWQQSQQAQQSQRQQYPQQYPGYGGGMQYPYGTGYGNVPTMFNPYGRRRPIISNQQQWMQQRGLATDAQGNPVTNPEALPLTRFAVTKSGLFGKPRRWEAEFGNYNQNAAQTQRPEKVVTEQDLANAQSQESLESQEPSNYTPSSMGERLMQSKNRLLAGIGSRMTPIQDHEYSVNTPDKMEVDSLPIRPYESNNELLNLTQILSPEYISSLVDPTTFSEEMTPAMGVDSLPVRPYNNAGMYTSDDLRMVSPDFESLRSTDQSFDSGLTSEYDVPENEVSQLFGLDLLSDGLAPTDFGDLTDYNEEAPFMPQMIDSTENVETPKNQQQSRTTTSSKKPVARKSYQWGSTNPNQEAFREIQRLKDKMNFNEGVGGNELRQIMKRNITNYGNENNIDQEQFEKFKRLPFSNKLEFIKEAEKQNNKELQEILIYLAEANQPKSLQRAQVGLNNTPLYATNPFEEEDQAILNMGQRNDYGQVTIPDYNQQPSMQTEPGFSDYYSPEESINRAADMIGTGEGTAELMPQEASGYKTKGKFKNQFDVDFGAAWDMANYGARTVLGNLSEEEKKRQHYARMMGMQTGVDSVNRFRGNYATNHPNFRDPQAGQMMYSQQGGQFNIGDEVEMTDDEIAKFVAGGGKLRYV